MPNLTIAIGGREFEVACQEGEERFLRSAAQMLDKEAQVLAGQMGRMAEGRLLLMSGLMLADRTAGLEEQVRAAEDRATRAEVELAEIKAQPPAEPEKVEVPVIPPEVETTLSALAERSEALARRVEEMKSGGSAA